MDKHNRDLLIHALKGTLDTASRREFDLWVSNADNLRIYENALRIWDDAQRRAAAYTPDRDRLWEQLQSRIGVSGSPQPTEKYPKFGNKGQNYPFYATRICHTSQLVKHYFFEKGIDLFLICVMLFL